MENHQDQYDVLKQKIRSAFWRGIVLIGLTMWFIPGILFKFMGLTPVNDGSFVDGFVRFSYVISPRVSSISEIINVSKQEGDLLTLANTTGIFIILLTIWGGLNISSGWDYLIKKDVLRGQVRDEEIKESIRRRNNRK